jgi:RND family efflux transporter MFP subunit
VRVLPRIAGLLLFGLVLPGCAVAAAIVLNPAQQRALGVRVGSAEAAAELRIDGLPARAEPPPQAAEVIAAPLAGTVTALAVQEGQAVAAGQLLARVQSRDALMLAADLAGARSEAALATAQARRDASLLAEGIVPAARAEQSEARAAQARARLAEFSAARALAPPLRDGRPGEYALRAPFAGRVLERTLTLGEPVAALGRAFVLGRGDRIGLAIDVPGSLRALLRPGLPVEFGDGGQGRVVAVGAALDPASQRLRVRADAAAGTLLPGQSLQVTLRLPAPAGTWRVPLGALSRDGERAQLFVAAADGFHALPVRVLAQTDRDAWVQAALPARAQIALAGAEALAPLAGTP